jgi:Raf kinase inhibitor-like YbhB/YbcL family protein
MLEKLPKSRGHALHARRAALERILINKLDLRRGCAELTVSSAAFADHSSIPVQYTADGEAISPPLEWRGVPESAAAIALIVEDADSPTSEPLVHAIVADIRPHVGGLFEGQLRKDAGGALNLGRNSYLQQAWLPPDPPPGHGVHRYAFQIFALRAGAPLPDSPGRNEFASAIRERTVACGCLIGTYERQTLRSFPSPQC